MFPAKQKCKWPCIFSGKRWCKMKCAVIFHDHKHKWFSGLQRKNSQTVNLCHAQNLSGCVRMCQKHVLPVKDKETGTVEMWRRYKKREQLICWKLFQVSRHGNTDPLIPCHVASCCYYRKIDTMYHEDWGRTDIDYWNIVWTPTVMYLLILSSLSFSCFV